MTQKSFDLAIRSLTSARQGAPFAIKPHCLAGLLQRILKVEYEFPPHVKVSEQCRDLLSKILVDKPEKRITIPEIQKHPWYLEDLPPGVAEMNDNLPVPGPEVQVCPCQAQEPSSAPCFSKNERAPATGP